MANDIPYAKDAFSRSAANQLNRYHTDRSKLIERVCGAVDAAVSNSEKACVVKTGDLRQDAILAVCEILKEREYKYILQEVTLGIRWDHIRAGK